MSWTIEERNKFAKELVLTAKSYSQEMEFDVAKLIIGDLQDLNFAQCFLALTQYRRNPKNKFKPTGADIRSLVNPETDDKAVAVALARKIDKAISAHGYNWEEGYFDGEVFFWEANGHVHDSFKNAVLAELGPIGWATIRSKGGWKATCQSANEMEEGMFIAQTRDLIQSSIQLQRQGVDLTQLDMPKHGSGLIAPTEAIQQLMKPRIIP